MLLLLRYSNCYLVGAPTESDCKIELTEAKERVVEGSVSLRGPLEGCTTPPVCSHALVPLTLLCIVGAPSLGSPLKGEWPFLTCNGYLNSAALRNCLGYLFILFIAFPEQLRLPKQGKRFLRGKKLMSLFGALFLKDDWAMTNMHKIRSTTIKMF